MSLPTEPGFYRDQWKKAWELSANGDWIYEDGVTYEPEEILGFMSVMTLEADPINHPTHYTRFPIEVIQLTEHLNFCRGNAVKYIARAGHKDASKEIEDLEKAAWYIAREIERVKKQKEEQK